MQESSAVSFEIFVPLALKNINSTPETFTIPNGDFESGANSWTQYSSNGWNLIYNSGWPAGVTPHSGSWAAWLAGDDDEDSYIEQQVTVPAGQPYLGFWYWIASRDTCGNDFGYLSVNDSRLLTLDLCTSSSTGGWVQHVIDLTSYVGQSVTLRIQAVTNSSLNSDLYLDDVQFQSTATAAPLAGIQRDVMPDRK